MGNFRRTIVLLMMAIVLCACSTLSPEFDPPKVTVENVRSLPSEGIGPRFEILLRVANPNKQSLDIAGISYTIDRLDT